MSLPEMTMIHLGRKVIEPAFVASSTLVSDLIKLSLSDNQAFFLDAIMNARIDVLTVVNGGKWSNTSKQRYRGHNPGDNESMTRTVTTQVTFDKSTAPRISLP